MKEKPGTSLKVDRQQGRHAAGQEEVLGRARNESLIRYSLARAHPILGIRRFRDLPDSLQG